MTDRTPSLAIRLDAIPANTPHSAKLGDVDIILVRQGDRVSAFGALCPHVGAPLEKGTVCAGRLICPWHKAHFDASDGAVIESPSLAPLERFAVAVADGVASLDGGRLPPAIRAVVTDAAPDDADPIVVVGTGAAAAAAVSVFADAGHAGPVVWIGPEATRGPYDRTGLSKMAISGQQPPSGAPLRLAPGIERLALERVDGIVTALDAGARTITCADGRHIRYGRALIATGGTPVRPDLPGRDRPGVHVLRSSEDATALVAALGTVGRAVIVGASFVGLEVASGLRARGIGTTVLARDAIPFARVFGAAIGARLRRLHEDNGVVFVEGEAARLDGEDRVRAVVTDAGTRLDADLVLLATGVRPAAGFAAGLAADDGAIAVDRAMRAGDRVWAVGDVARPPGPDGERARIEHWRVAQEQARTAARVMLGGSPGPETVPYFWTAHVGERVDCLGHARDAGHVVIDGDLERLDFVGYVLEAGRVSAVVGCKQDAAIARLSVGLRAGLTLDGARTVARSPLT